jgi:hypothetical protein
MSTSLQLQEARSVSLFPSPVEWQMIKEQATMLVTTGFLPASIKTPEQAIAIALKGRELGIPPMQAFAHIHIIQGKPTISAELQLALIFKNCPGAVINYEETNGHCCVIMAKRPNGSAVRFSFTIDEAKKAGLLSKDSWNKYPSAMLRARAISIAARALFADAIMGCSYTPEELGAEVDDEGEVISVPSDDAQSKPPAPPAPAPVSQIQPKEAPKPAPVKTKKSLGAEILRVGEVLGLSQKELEQWAMDESNKPAAQMTIPELEKFLDLLLGEAGRMGKAV